MISEMSYEEWQEQRRDHDAEGAALEAQQGARCLRCGDYSPGRLAALCDACDGEMGAADTAYWEDREGAGE